MDAVMHTEPKPPHGSAEWLAVRHRDPQGRARLTASVASVLIPDPSSRTGCVNPFMTPADLATQMLAETPPEASWSEEIERGHEWEPTIIQSWHKRNQGRLLGRGPVTEMHCNGRWLANLDEIVEDPEHRNGRDYRCPLEVKTAKGYVEEIKPYWFWQGVAQRYCLNGTPGRVEWAWVDSDFVFKQATQWVTQDDLDRLVAAGEEWLSYIDLDMVPPSVVLSAQQVATLHPKPEMAVVDIDDDARGAVETLSYARREIGRWKIVEELAKAELAVVLAKAERGVYKGTPVVSWKASKDRTGFDAARFQAEHPDLWQQYQKTSPGARTMRILKGFDEMGDGDDGTDDEPF